MGVEMPLPVVGEAVVETVVVTMSVVEDVDGVGGSSWPKLFSMQYELPTVSLQAVATDGF